jgi:hypothetical protein
MMDFKVSRQDNTIEEQKQDPKKLALNKRTKTEEKVIIKKVAAIDSPLKKENFEQ